MQLSLHCRDCIVGMHIHNGVLGSVVLMYIGIDLVLSVQGLQDH